MRPCKWIPPLSEERGRVLLALLGFILFEFLSFPRWIVFDNHVRLVDFWLLFVFVVAVLRLVVIKVEKQLNDPVRPCWPGKFQTSFVLLFVLGIGGGVSLFFSQNLYRSAGEFVSIIRDLFVFCLAYYFMSVAGGHEKKIVLKFLVWMGVFQFVSSMGQYASDCGPIRIGAMVRVSGTLGNELGHYLVACLVIGLAILSRVGIKNKPYRALLCYSATLVPLILGQYRTALVLWGLSVVLGIIESDTKFVLLKRMMLVFGLAFFVSGVMILFQPVSHPGNNVYFQELTKRKVSTVHARVILWKSALRMFYAHPLTGVGIGNFGLSFERPEFLTPEQKSNLGAFKLSSEIDAHSEWLTRLAETGLAGTLPFGLLMIFLVCSSIRRLQKKRVSTFPLAASIFVLVGCVAGVTAGSLGGRLFWMFSGILAYDADPS